MFYRALLAAVAAVLIATPVFADDMTGATDTTGTEVTQTTEQTKVNINTATAKELMKVKGINASKARAIVAYRKKNGNFTSVDGLAQVKGFKKLNQTKLQTIYNQLTVE